MAKYYKSGATVWNSASSWSATSSAGSDNAGIPTATDAVIFDSGSGNCSLITTTGLAASIDFSAYTHTITFNAGLTVSGNMTLGASMGIAGSSTVAINANATLISNGKIMSVPFNISGAYTITIAGGSNFICSNTTTLNNASLVINTTTTEKFEFRGTSGQNITITCGGTATMYFTGTNTIASSTCTSNITFDCGANTTTFGSAQNLAFKTGTITYTSGTVTTNTSTLTIQGTCTLSTNGMNWATINMNPSPSLTNITITLNSLLSATNLANTNNMTSYAITFAGSAGFTVTNLNIANGLGALTLTNGNTYTVTTSIYNYSASNSTHNKINSVTPGTKVTLTLNNGASCNLAYVDGTDIDSSGGRTITTWKGTLSNTTNWLSYGDYMGTVGTTFAN